MGTLRELLVSARVAQDLVKHYFTYKIPSTMPSIEPSLQYRPVDSAMSSLTPQIGVASNSSDGVKLHPHDVDPYQYFHDQNSKQQKTVNFEETERSQFPRNNDRPQERDNRFRAITRSPNLNEPRSINSPVFRPRSPSQIPNRGEPRKCHICDSIDHLMRDSE